MILVDTSVLVDALTGPLAIAIAATALAHEAALWTLHADDFRDLPGLRLYVPSA